MQVQLAPRDRLIVALDVSRAAEAREIVSALGEEVSTYKVGKQLFTAEGPDFVRELLTGGKRIFLDLKFHDIPNTVASAVREAAALGVHMLTVHALGGSKMLRAAAEAAGQSQNKPLVLAVTVLTSMAQADLDELGLRSPTEEQVLRLASLARTAGCGGIVASAHEAQTLRRELGGDFAIVTPGVRPAGAQHGDQARVLTPADAIRAGATYLVVGRPITEAADRARAARQILDEIQAATGLSASR